VIYIAPTPHIEAKEGAIAKIVLMSGYPLRTKYISDTPVPIIKCFVAFGGLEIKRFS
jgi:purine-nucleoside phosphorylase